MSLEGRITVELRPGQAGDERVRITSTRPTDLARHFAGRQAETVVRDLPLLFSVCGVAQAAASATACARALGLREGEATARARRLLVMAETLREHLIRILQGLSRLEADGEAAADPIKIMRVLPDLREALSAEDDPLALGAKVTIDPSVQAERIASLDALLEEAVFGEPVEQWLVRRDSQAFEAWARAGQTAAARLAAYVLRAGWAASGRGATHYLPALPDAALMERLTDAERARFVACPDWQGKACETSALARLHGEPLVAALLQTHGSGILTRLAARLLEVARMPGEMRALLPEDLSRDDESPLDEGLGLAQVEAARGRLVHGVAVEGDAVRDYVILAPTEWNFHPRGSLAEALAGLEADDEDALRGQAGLLIEAVDPCVGYELRVQ